MSINSALLAGVSGLTANAAALAAISQNIANVNTVGYKRTASDFSTVVNSQSRGTGYSAGGVQATARHFISQNGQLQRTASSTDLGIEGQGFFVVADRAENLLPTDTRLFTRAGAFTPDKLGYLQNTAGLYLQGWPIDNNGNINSDPSDLNRLRSINIGNVGGTAEPTTRIQLNANLNDAQPLNPDLASYDAADPAFSLAPYNRTDEAPTGFNHDFRLTVPVSDSKGGQRTLAISFLKSDVPNEWFAEIHAVPASDVAGTGTVPGQLASGRVRFTSEGRLDITAMTGGGTPAVPVPAEGWLFADFSNPSLTLAASNDAAATGPKWATAAGIDAQVINFDLNTSAGGLSQLNTESGVLSTITNGTAFGNLSAINIDKEGFVTANFDNGVTRRIAQLAIATFTSPDNLLETSGNAYQVSQTSGTFNLKTAGAGGAGDIAASQLEASNVDLSAEFTGLITTQRAYSASSKIITTADEMLAELISIKR
ncbi:flagellar hook-basal body complex protein [Brevundimonas variabilis]|uniref:Flagellar hook protein FlgE n=1 Tax=Brevundimonas variabilis TaxID=74312 RepID=A0A7W9CKX0_9CAUL|nr:flagellar hook-basal body complex protein [Brevundimonas variabilis]MBB5747517.1 flagellar hook protein FlgE [Brevundimonas variabilis]